MGPASYALSNADFMHLSDLFDEIFAAKYAWERAVIAPEKIVDY